MKILNKITCNLDDKTWNQVIIEDLDVNIIVNNELLFNYNGKDAKMWIKTYSTEGNITIIKPEHCLLLS
jgi:hypothetical protein